MNFDSEVLLSSLEELNVFLVHGSYFQYSIFHILMLGAAKIKNDILIHLFIMYVTVLFNTNAVFSGEWQE